MTVIETLAAKANRLPLLPGVYLMKNDRDEIIYVGKAIKLKNRVSSYFHGKPKHPKTARLVADIRDFEVIIAKSELDALLTECSLIKKYNPFYNIKLKNGGGYPYICLSLKNGKLPILTLEKQKTGKGTFFGPFTSAGTANRIIKLLTKIFLLPACAGKKNTVKAGENGCIEYQINTCRGFCLKNYDTDQTATIVKELSDLMNGNTDPLLNSLEKQMTEYAENLEYEKAAQIRDRIQTIRMINDIRRPLIAQNRNADYISWVSSEYNKGCTFFILKIRNGFITGERCDSFDDEISPELICQYIEIVYEEENKIKHNVYIESDFDGFEPLKKWLNDKLLTPTYEQDKEILKICRKNATERRLILDGKANESARQLESFKHFSGIEKARYIEMYDISSLAGENAVCGMITVTDGAFDKKKYKKFKIKKEYGFDDTAHMKEAFRRRLDRFREGDESFSPLPELVICDGALGQIHALESILKEYDTYIKVIGLKKDSKHRTKAIVFSDGRELNLITNRDSFTFCTKMQDEVHRFAISYHKNLRDTISRQSILTEIPGIGKKRAKDMIMKYKSPEKIIETPPEEIAKAIKISEKLAEDIIEYLKKEI